MDTRDLAALGPLVYPFLATAFASATPLFSNSLPIFIGCALTKVISVNPTKPNMVCSLPKHCPEGRQSFLVGGLKTFIVRELDLTSHS